MSHGTAVRCPRGTHRQKAWAPFLTPSPTGDLGHGFTPKPLCLAHRVSLVNVTGSQAHQHAGRCGKAHDAAQDSRPQEKSPEPCLTGSQGITAMWSERGWHRLSTQTPGPIVTATREHQGEGSSRLTGEIMHTLPSATRAGNWDPTTSMPRLSSPFQRQGHVWSLPEASSRSPWRDSHT